MTTFVLVHGAMHGGWCWRDVRGQLVEHGHTVFTPTLTGQGDRRHLLTPDVGIGTHVQDLADLLWFEDLDDVCLVLHSYAGLLAGPLVDIAADRIRMIIHMGSMVGRPGECTLDVQPPETAARYRGLVERDHHGGRIPASDDFLTQWGLTDPAHRAWVGPRLTDFPFRCLSDPIFFDEAKLAAVRQIYVRHTDPPLHNRDRSYERAVAAGWEVHDLATSHDLMVVDPDATAAILERLAP